MAYDFYMDGMLLPVTPSKLQLKIKNQNKTITLINEGEMNVLKKPGLTEISFTALIPQVLYPFASRDLRKSDFYLERFETLKNSLKPFRFFISRKLPSGKVLFDTIMDVSMENYTVTEDAKSGFDLLVDINLKQYKEYGTKIIKIVQPEAAAPQAQVTVQRSGDATKIGIGSNVMVNGQLCRDSNGRVPGQTRTNYLGKVNFINLSGSHPYHITTPAGAYLGWVTAASVKAV
jgi:hypothetical protein